MVPHGWLFPLQVPYSRAPIAMPLPTLLNIAGGFDCRRLENALAGLVSRCKVENRLRYDTVAGPGSSSPTARKDCVELADVCQGGFERCQIDERWVPCPRAE